MESSSTLRSLPPRKKLREGQQRVVNAALQEPHGILTVQLPTGYGKTLAAAATFAALWSAGKVDRLLYLVPTSAQLRQFCDDGYGDFLDAGLDGAQVWDVGLSEVAAVKKHRKNTCAVFAATIQAVVSGNVGSAVRAMMETGRWMVVVDEYHHYGIDKAWGRAVMNLQAVFTLAMSATPERPGNDSAFGAPRVPVSYLEALKEGAVKRLTLHSYEYRVDAITVNGEPVSFTTTELTDAVGSDDPHAIDKYMVDRKLRWSPKFISPLVSIPVERLLNRHAAGIPAQMIVGAMGCLHAQMVCEQIRSMFGDMLRIDWVGTGPEGRGDKDNERVISKFCPPKRDGMRCASDVQLDILVHVGMAGEGLDSVFVTEVVHLNKATISNQNDQENGRAARRIPGVPEQYQYATINVDSSSPYAEWRGAKIMKVFDRRNGETPSDDEDEPTSERERSNDGLPPEPMVLIADCELEHIDRGDPEVKSCARAMGKVAGYPEHKIEELLKDIDHPLYDAGLQLRKRELQERARGQNGRSEYLQMKEILRKSVGSIASLAVRQGSGMARPDKSQLGAMCKRLNAQMKRVFGSRIDAEDVAELRSRYNWLRQVEAEIKLSGIPQWLQ